MEWDDEDEVLDVEDYLDSQDLREEVPTQRAQYPLIKEYILNHNITAPIMV